MKVYKYIVIVSILLFSNICDVYANSCDSDDIKRLRVLAKNIEVTYEAKDECGTIFDVYFNNISDEFYIHDTQTGFLYFDFDVVEGKYQISNEKKGRHTYVIYSNSCDEKLTSFSADLYKENKYASNELCKGYENLDVCKKKYDTCNISEEEFKKVLASSIKNDSNISDDNSDIESNGLIEFINDNYLYVICGVFLIFIIIILIIIRNKRRSGVLE